MSACTDCKHEHAGPELGGICIGCACRATKNPDSFTCLGCKQKIVFGREPKGHATPETAARVYGWRVWSGETLGGRTKQFVLCPVCAGTASPQAAAEQQSWSARCETCDASMEEDWEDDREPGDPFTEDDARRWARDHDCEPSIVVNAPSKLVSA